jgi:hypothetical protein
MIIPLDEVCITSLAWWRMMCHQFLPLLIDNTAAKGTTPRYYGTKIKSKLELFTKWQHDETCE